MVEVESFPDQAHILIDADGLAGIGLDLDVLLADGFDEAHLIEAFLQARYNGQRGGSFADVLFGGSDEDWTLISAVGKPLPELGIYRGGIVGRGGVAIGLWVRISK